MEVILLSHNGLGDNILMFGAIRFLLNYYEKIYFIVKSHNKKNVEMMISDENIVIKEITDYHNYEVEIQSCRNLINSLNSTNDKDLLICGAHKNYFKSIITNKKLLEYVPNNKHYNVKFSHLEDFYNDIHLDISIFYEYFHINSTVNSTFYYNKINKFKIVFCHTKASDKEIFIDVTNFVNDDNYIVICSNKNMYSIDNSKYNLANEFVNLLLTDYIDIILNSSKIFVIDSSFACIIYPLHGINKLKADEVNIITR